MRWNIRIKSSFVCFNYLEEHTIKQGKELKNMTLEEMDAIWNEAKSKGL